MPAQNDNAQLTLSSATPREFIPAGDVQPGDFTHITGYRRVTRIDRKPRKRTVRLHWVDGSSRVLRYDDRIRVRHGR